MSEELKPCPFCGSKKLLNVKQNLESYAQWYYVSCDNCDARGSEDISKEEAISAWNRRK